MAGWIEYFTGANSRRERIRKAAPESLLEKIRVTRGLPAYAGAEVMIDGKLGVITGAWRMEHQPGRPVSILVRVYAEKHTRSVDPSAVEYIGSRPDVLTRLKRAMGGAQSA